ncbi:MAG: histidine--tRNA ligase [Phycisphaerae bacterium]|nr:histidine--tRNA ligase [Phycisphaerae bacterium]
MPKIPPVKGTRDFYPAEMAIRNWIAQGWREVSQRNGFVEYDGPIFEYLQLYTQKSGDEIVSQLFSIPDRAARDGRDLAIRPEITPTLARMVNQQINALPRPIKWFSIPRLCRAERPQRGRLREFFQWNIDIIGSDSVLADAESIFTAIDYLRSLGLKASDVVARISSRSMLAELLMALGFAREDLDKIYVLLDKRPKMTESEFSKYAAEQISDADLLDKMMRLEAVQSLDELEPMLQSDAARKGYADLCELFKTLKALGVGDYCEFDIKIVRGLAYYTGPVFEIFDRGKSLRALCGGGRYDNLLSSMGGPQVPATGFGMGDVVLELLLAEKGLLRSEASHLDFFVINADTELDDKMLMAVSRLRSQGYATAFSYKKTGVGKQFKQAAAQNARHTIVMGRETIESNQITLKNMADGSQKELSLDKFLENPEEIPNS